ncbi:hypothetical protein QE152_g37464 [Popillia japonica]|uniref:Uncharacterized protein n=1 Tax=Popillia japonica TaxID=7064 RepID=A0AAW1IA24_POPJA
MKQHQKEHKPNKTEQQMKNNLKRKLFIDSSSSESDVELEKICNDSTDNSITEENEVPNESLSEGNFVLNLDYYLTYLTKGLGWTLTYPEKKDDGVQEKEDIVMKLPKPEISGGLGWTLTYPEKKDDGVQEKEDIVMKLPKPEISGGTERASKKFKFNVDLTDFSVY